MHFIKGQIINFEIKWLQKLTCDNLEGLTECDNVSQWKDLLSDNSVTYWVLSSCKDSVCQLSYYFSSLNSDPCVSLHTRLSQSDRAPECSSMHSIPTSLTFLSSTYCTSSLLSELRNLRWVTPNIHSINAGCGP